jgi:hypothetical protein
MMSVRPLTPAGAPDARTERVGVASLSPQAGRGGKIPSTLRRVAIAALLLSVLQLGARAQSGDDRGGLRIRQVSLSTGYTFVELPPIALGGMVPADVLAQDLMTSGTVAIDWWRVTPRTRYMLDVFGTYTARTRYSQLNAPGGDMSFGVSRALGNRWRVDAGVATSVTNADRWAFQSSQARRLVDEAGSFEDLSGAVVLARSAHPDPSQAVLFVPISESFSASDFHGERMMASSARVNAAYTHSTKLSTFVRGAATTVRRISSSGDRAETLLPVGATSEHVGLGVRYARSERTQLTASLDWTQISGVTADQVISGTIGYGWTGRKWFMEGAVGAGGRPSRTTIAGDASATVPTKPVVSYHAAVGYKFNTQTLLVQYRRAAHDDYGHGGRNVETGFEGHVESVGGAWSWTPPRGRWTARVDASLVRRPGNFSYINAWLATAGIGRRVSPNVSVMGELLFDRHGSRAFEGFHLTREAARINVVWTRPRRPVE